jgi:hypothetical protein
VFEDGGGRSMNLPVMDCATPLDLERNSSISVLSPHASFAMVEEKLGIHQIN